MLQTFDVSTSPENGAPRVHALREWMTTQGIDGFLVPRADQFQGEYVAPQDERLAWLTGFTGSAGFACILQDVAGVFIDGRYRVQITQQVDTRLFTPVPWPETGLVDWLYSTNNMDLKIGFDPWLHTAAAIEDISAKGVTLVAKENGIDEIWSDRPAPEISPVFTQPEAFSGEGVNSKCGRIASKVKTLGADLFVITDPESISWLLNIRGNDIPRTPLVHAFACLHTDGSVIVFSDLEKFGELKIAGPVSIQDWREFTPYLLNFEGKIGLNVNAAPFAVLEILQSSGQKILRADDPCVLQKAMKNAAEIEGTRKAHIRDAGAMCRFLSWFDRSDTKSLNEIDIVQKLEGFRQETGKLRDISFETIAGSGPNGAIVHYRVNSASNRPLDENSFLLVDSGGQYQDGTTDITRTLALGTPAPHMKAAFTRVLQGMIAISRARFPVGISGRDIDVLARLSLWQAGQDYDHGTGHGVGSYLSVHEGPQRISRASMLPLQQGMILSNEPGYYREGEFGVRIENLIVVSDAPKLPSGDPRPMLEFETLTWVPIDKACINAQLLSSDEVTWLDSYHAQVFDKVAPLLEGIDLDWLKSACAPL